MNTAEILNFSREGSRVKADLDGGFSQVAWDLTRELRNIKYHFSPRETALIWALIEKLYGPEKHESLVISDGKLAEWTDMPRQKVQETRAALLKRKILFVAEDGSLGLNRATCQWETKTNHSTSAHLKKAAPEPVTCTGTGADVTPEPVQNPAPEPVLFDAPEPVQYLDINEDIKTRENNIPDFSKSGKQSVSDFYLTKKKRKLTGKRLSTFNRFWKAFSYTEGKAEAADAWLEIPELTNKLVDLICFAAEQEARKRPAKIAEGKTPKMAQGWITGRRWEAYENMEPEAFTDAQQVVVDGFAKHCGAKYASVGHWTPARAAAISVILNENLVKNWDKFWAWVAGQEIFGANGFDWFMKLDNFVKVWEGAYATMEANHAR